MAALLRSLGVLTVVNYMAKQYKLYSGEYCIYYFYYNIFCSIMGSRFSNIRLALPSVLELFSRGSYSQSPNTCNYHCPVCMASGKVPNIAGKFHLISETHCRCNGCQTVYEKEIIFRPVLMPTVEPLAAAQCTCVRCMNLPAN
jgi:hypothetical protein